MRGARIYHNTNGWIIETPVPLTETQLKAAIKFHKDVLLDRSKGWSDEKRRVYSALIAGLDEKTIRHKLTSSYPWERDRILV